MHRPKFVSIYTLRPYDCSDVKQDILIRNQCRYNNCNSWSPGMRESSLSFTSRWNPWNSGEKFYTVTASQKAWWRTMQATGPSLKLAFWQTYRLWDSAWRRNILKNWKTGSPGNSIIIWRWCPNVSAQCTWFSLSCPFSSQPATNKSALTVDIQAMDCRTVVGFNNLRAPLQNQATAIGDRLQEIDWRSAIGY